MLMVMSARAGMGRPSERDNSSQVVFDRFKSGRRQTPTEALSVAWHVSRDGVDIVVNDGDGHEFSASTAEARAVRIVPLSGSSHHAAASGWQVTLSTPDGDALLGKPLQDWRSAQELARLVCEQTNLPLDELTQRMFSRVGQLAPRTKG